MEVGDEEGDDSADAVADADADADADVSDSVSRRAKAGRSQSAASLATMAKTSSEHILPPALALPPRPCACPLLGDAPNRIATRALPHS